jgi:tetratricopeptide (TPR) repeat protein
VILDLRLDRGGNGDLRFGLVKSLIKAEDDDTRLFVLVGRGTFSASQFILDDLDRFSDAVFVGEPASSKPNAYGDGYRINLPNSGLRPSASIYWWQIDQGPRDFTPIDVAAPLTFAAYAAGRDPALEAALAFQPKPTLEAQLLAVADAGGDVLQAFETWRADVANRYVDTERQLVIAGQSLYRAKHPQEAIAITEAAIAQYPQSVDPPAVLAFLGEWTGNKELALKGAARALELDPDNRQMRALVERVNGTAKPD